MGVVFRTMFDNTVKLARFLGKQDELADALAQAVIAHAAPNIPVLTGSARDSLYVSSALGDGYQAAVEAANADRESANAAPAVITDPVEKPSKGSGKAIVASVVGHMWTLELGGVKAPPRPAILPAVDAVQANEALAILSLLLDKAMKA